MSTPEALPPGAWALTHRDGRVTLHLAAEYATAYRDTCVSEAPLYTKAALDLKNAEIERLTAALDEARAEASVAYLAFEQVKASRAELRKAIAALLDDDDHDTAKALARAALKGNKP
jgi:cyanate lyase